MMHGQKNIKLYDSLLMGQVWLCTAV